MTSASLSTAGLSRPPQSRADQTLEKKNRLLDVAREQFVRRGYRYATMEVIAQAAGVSKRSLYLWHEDKSALFTACVKAGAQRFPRFDHAPGDNINARLKSFGINLVREFMEASSIGMGKLLIRESGDFPELRQISESSWSEYLIAPLAAHLGQANVTDGDPVQAANILTAMILMPVHNHLLIGTALPNPEAIENHVSTVTEIFMRGTTVDPDP